MEKNFLNLDYWLFNLINQKSTFYFADLFFPWVTDLHHTVYFKFIFVAAILFMFVKKYKRVGLSLFLILVMSLSVNDFVGAQVKNYFMRPRPFENLEIVATQKSPAGSKSFYSNHASNMFTFATYTSQFIPVLKIPTYVLATVISYSRVYNGVHYPSDVIAGGIIGTLWGYLFSFLAKKMMRLLNRKKEDL
jgi:undecaprenyl-diphosphatase